MPSSSRAPVAEDLGDQSFVDAAHRRSVSFAGPAPSIQESLPNEIDREARRAPIAVGPAHPAVEAPAVRWGGGLLGAMPEFPIQVSKVQPPPLREQTLARDRLLDWLAAKIHDRVVLVVAEAGYGKTTLLADFSRRTRLRSLWYRLDRGDRDWVGFIAHLAAAVRVHVPEFGPATASLLRETAASAPSLETVLDTFLRELGSLPPDPTVLILDDFHLVDDTAEIRHVVKELLARAPELLTVVFVSRRVPPVPLARLRALGEVAEIGTDDLRFDAAETDRLFRETYEMPLESSLITELSRRTEGWAASLQLVRAALHDRDAVQARAFIGSLSGAEGHLYDYLAEEVIGDLPAPLQDFLMRTSILETVDLELGPVAAGVTVEAAKDLLEQAEAVGLLIRRGRASQHQARLHPLVRDFLTARLERIESRATLIRLHAEVASAAEQSDWRAAAHHYIEARDPRSARRVLAASIDTILATGRYTTAHNLASMLGPTESPDSASLIVSSRIAMVANGPTSSLELAERAWAANPASTAATLNLMTARTLAGDVAGAIAVGLSLEQSDEGMTRVLARTARVVFSASHAGSLVAADQALKHVLDVLRDGVNDHFLGVARLNQAMVRVHMHDLNGALEAADESIRKLESTSAGVELVSAVLERAIALAHLGRIADARAEIAKAHDLAGEKQLIEVAIEATLIETFFGDDRSAIAHIESVRQELDGEYPVTDNVEQALFVRSLLHARLGDLEHASADFGRVRPGVLRTYIAFEAQRQVADANLKILMCDPEAAGSANAARAFAAKQGARTWELQAELLEGLAAGTTAADKAVIAAGDRSPTALSISAEAVMSRLRDLGPEAVAVVISEARRRPERWRPTVRRALLGSDATAALGAGRILEEIGVETDVQRLRAAAKSLRTFGGDALGKSLARRLAPRVLVEDLGRVRIVVGLRSVEGSDLRRKVLALLCFLLTRARFSSTRDEVLDALWPDLDPGSALNSLNQTVYFLRRVFEPGYREETSPGYLKQDGETIWLDPELVDSRSRRCRDLVRAVTADPPPALAIDLSAEYRGRFALDFAYEEWAGTYRETLHASYLRVIEQAIRLDMNAGAFSRAVTLAERAAEVDPESDEIQLALIRLYRMLGAHAAAAESYARYAHDLKTMGLEAPTFDEVLGGTRPIGTPAY